MVPQCPHCIITTSRSQSRIVIHGFFNRRRDSTQHKRFRCLQCKKTFSTATLDPCFRQKKRDLNPKIFISLVSGVSQRRAAHLFSINRKTVIRKFLFLASLAEPLNKTYISLFPKASEIQFDDLETFEHSKLKPLSVTMAVESSTRRILGFRVSSMPAKGLLVKRALKRYGPRKDLRREGRQGLFKEIKSLVSPEAIIKSDENPHYPKDVRRFFPRATHKVYPGRRGCVVGQGELKAGGFDPLFSLNHSFAMLRANINRLFRRTWNTTKKPERLARHLALYVFYHNAYLIFNKAR